jgi:hypothetical protein
MEKCDLWKKLNQECLTCTLVAGIKDVFGPGRDSMVVGFTNYLYNQCISPLKL